MSQARIYIGPSLLDLHLYRRHSLCHFIDIIHGPWDSRHFVSLKVRDAIFFCQIVSIGIL